MASRPQALRRTAAAALLPLALGSLAACGDDAGSGGVKGGVSAQEAGFSAGDDVQKDEFLEVYEAALADATTAKMRMVTSTPQAEIEAEGEVDYTTDPPSMAMTMEVPGAPDDIEMRMVEGAVYMTVPGIAEDKFLKIDLDEPGNPFGQMTGQMDMRAQIDVFDQGLTEATYEGEDDVDGESMDHYTLVADTEAMFAATEMDESLRELAMQQAPESIEYDIWIDEDGLFRKMAIAMGDSLGDVTIEHDDWGTDVDIEAPPADQVSDSDLADLMGGLAG